MFTLLKTIFICMVAVQLSLVKHHVEKKFAIDVNFITAQHRTTALLPNMLIVDM